MSPLLSTLVTGVSSINATIPCKARQSVLNGMTSTTSMSLLKREMDDGGERRNAHLYVIQFIV